MRFKIETKSDKYFKQYSFAVKMDRQARHVNKIQRVKQ
jgi:hypothetical protein